MNIKKKKFDDWFSRKKWAHQFHTRHSDSIGSVALVVELFSRAEILS
jgi:hypothetical protein